MITNSLFCKSVPSILSTEQKIKIFLENVNKSKDNDFDILNSEFTKANEKLFSNELQENYVKKIFSPNINNFPNSILLENLYNKRKNIFNVIYRDRSYIFNKIKNDILLNDEEFLNKKSQKRRSRRENHDNIRKKIKTRFFNNALIKKLNEKLRIKKSKSYFEKFSTRFVNDIRRKTNREIINLTLLEIISKKELYNENDLNKYYHNLNVIENKEIEENEELNVILNKTYCELFQEYINSKEFIIDEINRLKNKNMNDTYIKRYICLAKHLIEFFSE